MWILSFLLVPKRESLYLGKGKYVVDMEEEETIVLFHAFNYQRDTFLFTHEAIQSSSLLWLLKFWEIDAIVGKLCQIFFKTCAENYSNINEPKQPH